MRDLRALDLAAQESERARSLGEKGACLVEASERVLPEANGVVAAAFFSELRHHRERVGARKRLQDSDECPVPQHVMCLGSAC